MQVPIYARATSGAALTGKVAADFALSYRRDGAAVSIALSNLTALTDAHSDGGIKEVGNGEYRLDVPDAAFAAGASKVTIGGTVDGGVVLGYPIELAISAWDELKSEHTTAGTFGLWLGTDLAALIEAISLDGVWSYATRTLTQTAAQVADALDGENLTIHRGDTFSATLTGLGSLTGRTALWFTVKRTPATDLDAAAKIQIEETDGLTILNGESYATAVHGSLTVGSGTVAISIHGLATAQLSPMQGLYYDLQVIDADGDPITIAEGRVDVDADVTRATAAASSPGA